MLLGADGSSGVDLVYKSARSHFQNRQIKAHSDQGHEGIQPFPPLNRMLTLQDGTAVFAGRSNRPISGPHGTTVSVKDIFHNVRPGIIC